MALGPESLTGARWALSEAADRHLDLVVAHGYALPLADQVWAEHALSAPVTAARTGVEELLSQLTIPASVKVHRVVEPSRPASLLEELSRRAELVVVGRDDRTSFQRMTRGSTTAAICASAACAVVVVPPHLRPLKGPELGMVALDGLTAADSALRIGFEEAERRSMPLLVLHAGDQDDDAAEIERRQVNVAEILAGWKADHPEVSVDVDVVRGDPAATVCSHAMRAALMVVGRPHCAGLRSWSRSVANAVLDHCGCPLVVTPGTPLPIMEGAVRGPARPGAHVPRS